MTSGPEKRPSLTIPIILLSFAVGFVGLATWHRLHRQPVSQRREDAAPAPAVEVVQEPKDAGADGRDIKATVEAATFRATCSVCHDPPPAKLYDQTGWPGLGRKMKERMSDRMDIAIRYLVSNARPGIQFAPLAAASGSPPASQPAGADTPATQSGETAHSPTPATAGSAPSPQRRPLDTNR